MRGRASLMTVELSTAQLLQLDVLHFLIGKRHKKKFYISLLEMTRGINDQNEHTYIL